MILYQVAYRDIRSSAEHTEKVYANSPDEALGEALDRRPAGEFEIALVFDFNGLLVTL